MNGNVDYQVVYAFLFETLFYVIFPAGLGEMHLCDEVCSSFTLPVEEMCLIPAIALDEIAVKLRQSLIDVNKRSVLKFLLSCNTESC